MPFGEGQATVNLLGGRVEGVVQLPPALIAHVKSGDLRVLAALGSKRDRIFPDTPTATEAGYPVALDLWRGIVVPKDTPRDGDQEARGSDPGHCGVAGVPGGGRRRSGFCRPFLPADEFGRLIAADDSKLASVMDKLWASRSADRASRLTI